MTATAHKLLQLLEKQGYQARIVPAQRIHDLEHSILGAHRQRLFDESFYQERLSWFRFEFPKELPNARSLIVVAVPSPQTQVAFSWNGAGRTLVLPPTYVGYERVRQQAEKLIATVLTPAGYRVAQTQLPLKLLAVCSGLGRYGRNNIVYVPGMGSFHELVAVYSDLPCPEEAVGNDGWQEPQMLEECENCYACRRRCPSGAIPSDRFLLRAERCLVFHNERPANTPFPAWIDPGWHNCLIGCMACQSICPLNREHRDWIEGEEAFLQEETELLLRGLPFDQLPVKTQGKLERLDLTDSVDILPRNLGVFFKQLGR